LLDAIEACAPPANGTGLSRASRRHRLLVLRYVDGKEPAEVQAELAVSQAQLYRDQRSAVEQVAAILWGRWRLAEPSANREARAGRGPGDRAGMGWPWARL